LLSGDALADAATSDPEDATWWVHELVGCSVLDRDGHSYGQVAAIQAKPAHDLLVLDGGALVPLPFVVERHDGRVVIDPPEGLFDL
jgi:16S rRNA processing protein RimM